MRAALWFLSLFGIAVAAALFAGNNQASVTLFWAPWRVDFSLNLVLLGLLATFVLLHLALRALAALFGLPQQARQWRAQQRERALFMAMLDGLSQLMSGRYLRARKSALSALAQEAALLPHDVHLPYAAQVRALAHLLAADSAHALQDSAARELHVQAALAPAPGRSSTVPTEAKEAAQLRAARWALDERDPTAALERLAALPQGAARRTLALRIRLKAARQAGQTPLALETARLLAKHRAFSADAGQSLLRSLGQELLASAHDAQQLRAIWAALDAGERAMPELAILAAQRMLQLDARSASRATSREWLLPVWERYSSLSDQQRLRLVVALEKTLRRSSTPESTDNADAVDTLAASGGSEWTEADSAWLARIEAAQLRTPRDALLQYLCGMGCMERQLWGKAQQHLGQSAHSLQDSPLRRQAWRALARLAEQRGDTTAAQNAYQQAAGV